MPEKISPADLFDRLYLQRDQHHLAVVDLRDPKDVSTYCIDIPAEALFLNIPVGDFKKNFKTWRERLPVWKEIVFVCPDGKASADAAAITENEGFSAAVLADGMKGWYRGIACIPLFQKDEIRCWQIVRFGKGCLGYILSCGNEAVLIDVPFGVECVNQFIDGQRLKPVAVIETHLQADHISGGWEFARRSHCPYFVGSSDFLMYGPAFQDVPLIGVYQRYFLEHSSFGRHLKILQTPGHTPGSISLLFNERFLFSGDTLLLSGPGRTDLSPIPEEQECNVSALYTTLQELVRLPDNVVIFPAHFASFSEMNPGGFFGESFRVVKERGKEIFSWVLCRDGYPTFYEYMMQKREIPVETVIVQKVNRGEIPIQDFSHAVAFEGFGGMNHCAASR